MNVLSVLDINNLIYYYNTKLIHNLRYGRLATHESVKVALGELGHELGYTVISEYHLRYSLNGLIRKGRIDIVWLKNSELIAVFEVEEGLSTRGIGKMLSCECDRYLVMFDIRHMMKKAVDKFNFNSHKIIPIFLDGYL